MRICPRTFLIPQEGMMGVGPFELFLDSMHVARVSRSLATELNANFASLAEETLAELDKLVAENLERMKTLLPDLEYKEPKGSDFLPLFIEYLKGREYHDPDENA
ncbi:MAG: hypothetical protein WDZ61_00020 [Parcubacteria group bacterium]